MKLLQWCKQCMQATPNAVCLNCSAEVCAVCLDHGKYGRICTEDDDD